MICTIKSVSYENVAKTTLMRVTTLIIVEVFNNNEIIKLEKEREREDISN